jgi:hypothetical protein
VNEGGRFMKKCKNVKVFVIVFSLLVIFPLPSVLFATSSFDIQPGNVDNTLKLSLDNSRSVGSDGIDNHRPRHESGGQLQTTPIPSAAWLLGTGLVGLFGISRKQKKLVNVISSKSS